MIKILHTSDWHLGKKLYGLERHEEHVAFVKWLIELLSHEKIDILIISGDIFDSPNPPHKSLQLFYQFLREFEDKTQATLYAIGGNHDSGLLIEAPQILTNKNRIYLVGQLHAQDIQKHFFVHQINHHKIGFFLLPFFRSLEIEKIESSNHEDGLINENQILLTLEHVFKQYDIFLKETTCDHSILVAHHLFGSFMPSGSEQGVYLSGLETIPLSLLKNYFDYVALGHIHRPQLLKKDQPIISYCGSPLEMRFSEVSKTIKKQVRLIRLENQKISSEPVFIPLPRNLIRIEGNYKNTTEAFEESHFIKNLKTLLEEQNCDANIMNTWIEAKVWIEKPESDLFEKTDKFIKKYFGTNHKKIKTIKFQSIIEREDNQFVDQKDLIHNTQLTTENLFQEFYKSRHTNQETPPKKLQEELKACLEEIRRESSS